MPQFMISVWHASGIQQRPLGSYDSEADMQAAFQAVSTFNESLQAEGAWVYACGLEAPENAVVIDGSADGDPAGSKGPYAEASAHLGGFWVVEAPGPEQARELAARASAACGNRVELRRLQG